MKEYFDALFEFTKFGVSQDRKIFKKSFYEKPELNSERRKIIKNDIDAIIIIGLLNEDTISITPYKNDKEQYEEIYFIQVTLKNAKNAKSIAECLHMIIPNPIVLLMVYNDNILISVAPKRLHEQSKGVVVVDKECHSTWIDTIDPPDAEAAFLDSLVLDNLPFDNLRTFYYDICRRVLYSQAIPFIGQYKYTRDQEIYALHEMIKEIINEQTHIAVLKKEEKDTPNFGDKIDLHIKLQEAQHKMEDLIKTI